MTLCRKPLQCELLLLIGCLAAAGCGAHSVGKTQQAAVHYVRGTELACARYFEFALQELNEAVRLDPDVASGLGQGGLAWIYATCPDASLRNGENALSHANLAAKIAGRQPTHWGRWFEWAVLAAAYAETGDFDRATAAQQRAIELADQCDDKIGPQLQRNVRACLKLYEAGRPLRTPHVTLALVSDAWAQRVLSGDFPDVAE